MRYLLLVAIAASTSCSDPGPAPADAALPSCSELGCSSVICTTGDVCRCAQPGQPTVECQR